jgi:hypothetical protein
MSDCAADWPVRIDVFDRLLGLIGITLLGRVVVMSPKLTIPKKSDLSAAYGRIQRHVRRTPVIHVDATECGLAQTHAFALKLEFLQHSSSF